MGYDVREFEQDIQKEDATNPYRQNTKYYSEVVWKTNDDTWSHSHGYTTIFKCFIKSLNKMQILSDNEWIDLGVSDIVQLTQEEIEQYGMKNLMPLVTPTTIARKTMEDHGALGEGKLFRKTIDVSEFGRIEDIKFIRLEVIR